MSFNIMSAFEFTKKDTMLHNLDPRTKLLMIIVFSIVAFMFDTILPFALLFGLLAFFLITGKISKRVIGGLKNLMGFLIFLLLFNTWFMGFYDAFVTITRILFLMVSYALFFQSTTPDDLSEALLKLKLPFEFAQAITLAFRFIPTLFLETQQIMDAQRSRGHDLDRGGIIQKIRNLFPIVLPLIISSIRRAFSLAEALESRAFGTGERIPLYGLELRKVDYATMVGILGVFLVCIYIRITQFANLEWLLFSFNV